MQLIAAILALCLSVAGNLWQWQHTAVKAAEVRAQASGQLDLAKGANDGAMATIGALQTSIAECNVGRVFDRAAQIKAMAVRDAAHARIERDYSLMRAKMLAAQAGDCRSWAESPACGIAQ